MVCIQYELFCYCMTTCIHSIVPDAPPHFVSVTTVNSSSVKVRWGDVPCAGKNGEITGYLINYTSTSAGGVSGEIMAQANTSSKIISDLSPCIAYNFRVAAMNINGTGPFQSYSTHINNKSRYVHSTYKTLDKIAVFLYHLQFSQLCM